MPEFNFWVPQEDGEIIKATREYQQCIADIVCRRNAELGMQYRTSGPDDIEVAVDIKMIKVMPINYITFSLSVKSSDDQSIPSITDPSKWVIRPNPERKL